MDSFRLSFKLFIQQPAEIDFDSLVPVFHSWIQTHAIPDHLLIDVANYAHVHDGPGIVLISHEANYSVDKRGGRPGLTYQRKQLIEGDFSKRIQAACRATLAAASLLTDRFKFDTGTIEFRICDRLNAPNAAGTFNTVKADLLRAFPGAKLEHQPSDQQLFTVLIHLSQPITIPPKP